MDVNTWRDIETAVWVDLYEITKHLGPLIFNFIYSTPDKKYMGGFPEFSWTKSWWTCIEILVHVKEQKIIFTVPCIFIIDKGFYSWRKLWYQLLGLINCVSSNSNWCNIIQNHYIHPNPNPKIFFQTKLESHSPVGSKQPQIQLWCPKQFWQRKKFGSTVYALNGRPTNPGLNHKFP